MDDDGSNVALLTAPWPYDVAASRESLSPDGTKLVFIGRVDGSPAVSTLDLVTMQTRVLAAFIDGQLSSPVWSPQGYRIAFVSSISGSQQIWIVARTGAGLRQLTSDSWGTATHPTFSPDGSRLAFTGTGEEGRRQVWVISVTGSRRDNLSDNGYDEWDPIWTE
jgi:Tol biopolymer transport system component